MGAGSGLIIGFHGLRYRVLQRRTWSWPPAEMKVFFQMARKGARVSPASIFPPISSFARGSTMCTYLQRNH